MKPYIHRKEFFVIFTENFFLYLVNLLVCGISIEIRATPEWETHHVTLL